MPKAIRKDLNMNFTEIRRQSIAEQEALEHSDKPRILIGSAICGRAAGSLAVLEAIQTKVAQIIIEAINTQFGCSRLIYAERLANLITAVWPLI